MRVSLDWTNGIKDEDTKKSFIEGLVTNPYIRLLQRIVAVRDLKVQRSEFSQDDFKEHSWAYKQAFRNGQRSAYNDIIRLLTFEKESQ